LAEPPRRDVGSLTSNFKLQHYLLLAPGQGAYIVGSCPPIGGEIILRSG